MGKINLEVPRMAEAAGRKSQKRVTGRSVGMGVSSLENQPSRGECTMARQLPAPRKTDQYRRRLDRIRPSTISLQIAHLRPRTQRWCPAEGHSLRFLWDAGVLIAKLTDHLIEGVHFRGIAVVNGREIPHRRLESRDSDSRVRKPPRIDHFRHDLSLPESDPRCGSENAPDAARAVPLA